MATLGAKALLMKEYRALQSEKWLKIDLKDDSIFKWSVAVMVIGNEDSYYNGGYFKAEMQFTADYPYSPPEFKFLRPLYHPNIYPDGKVCISILHPPGADEQSGELAEERWSPLQGVESVLRSILVLLNEPEVSSPANVDAGVMYRNDRKQYILRAKANVEASRKDIPRGFEMPTSLIEAPPPKIVDDDDFWNESDAEDDFGSDNFSASENDDDQDMEDDEDRATFSPEAKN